jgi:CubicO group peptidase (beta-lactamase class C family)
MEEFLNRIHTTPLLFEPGTNISYQSCGMALLAEIVHRVSGYSLAEFERREIFEPLGMVDTSLGVDSSKTERVSQVNIPRESFEYGESDADWNWNSSYWWNFGAPWGGMLSTPVDMITFLSMFLTVGKVEDRKVISPSTTRAMISNQIESMISIPEPTRGANPWGFGWLLKASASSHFGDLVSDKTFGHAGATGTLVWADPLTSLACVVFTNQPYDLGPTRRILGSFSNAVAASTLD